MESIRRVVTGHDESGKAVFASDEQVPPLTIAALPAAESFPIWGADQWPVFPDDGSRPAWRTWFPPVGGFRFQVVTIPSDFTPQGSSIDMVAAMREMEEKFPGAAATMESEHPGMHTTESIDLLYILSGRVILELDEGATREVQAGDTIVQNGTRHAWRNPYDEPCLMVGVQIGVEVNRG